MQIANIFTAPTTRVILSSAFSNRMLVGEALVHKADITVDEAKAIVAFAESTNVISFENALNPRHESTCVLAQGLTRSTPTGAMVSLAEGDVVVVMQPSAASRNDTEFVLEHFRECHFQLLQRLPMALLN